MGDSWYTSVLTILLCFFLGSVLVFFAMAMSGCRPQAKPLSTPAPVKPSWCFSAWYLDRGKDRHYATGCFDTKRQCHSIRGMAFDHSWMLGVTEIGTCVGRR